MNAWIENISMDDVRSGRHYDPGPGGILIQITDPLTPFPSPAYHFEDVYQFHFLDADGGFPEETLFSENQAREISEILVSARDSGRNVVVHCHAGICRSGAVVEAAVATLGFRDTGRIRLPNVRVKTMLFSALMERDDV